MASDNGQMQDRVRLNSPKKDNIDVDAKTAESLSIYSDAAPEDIEDRLNEVDREWDIERGIELQAAITALLGLVLGFTVNKKWFALPVINMAFLVQHSIQGWCPPVPLLRRFGFRTRKEIDKERYALKALRGDFRRTVHSPSRAWQSVQ
jgi:hypothetical protein